MGGQVAVDSVKAGLVTAVVVDYFRRRHEIASLEEGQIEQAADSGELPLGLDHAGDGFDFGDRLGLVFALVGVLDRGEGLFNPRLR